MKVVRSSPLRIGRLYPQEYPGTYLEAESTLGTWTCRIFRGGKKSSVTRQGIDPGSFQPVAQRLNHYANPCIKLHVQGKHGLLKICPNITTISYTVVYGHDANICENKHLRFKKCVSTDQPKPIERLNKCEDAGMTAVSSAYEWNLA